MVCTFTHNNSVFLMEKPLFSLISSTEAITHSGYLRTDSKFFNPYNRNRFSITLNNCTAAFSNLVSKLGTSLQSSIICFCVCLFHLINIHRAFEKFLPVGNRPFLLILNYPTIMAANNCRM